MASKAKVTAEVEYKTDENSYRQAAGRTRQMQEEYRRVVEKTAGQTTTTIRPASDPALAAQFAALKGQILSQGAPVAQMAAEMRARILSSLTGGPMGMRATGMQLRPQTMPEFVRRGAPADIVVRTNQAVDASKKLTQEQQRMGQAARGSSMGMLELARALDDVQYGLRGVINNIPGIVQAFNGSTKLAGQMGIIAASLGLVTAAWNTAPVKAGRGGILGNLFGDLDDETAARTAARMKDLFAAREELADRASKAAQAYADEFGKVMEVEDARRNKAEADVENANDLAAAENEIVKARIRAMEGSKREEALARNRFKVEEDALRAKRKLLNETTMIDAQAVINSEERVKQLRAELDAIKGISNIVGNDEQGRAVRRVEFTPEQTRTRAGLQKRIDAENAFQGDAWNRIRANNIQSGSLLTAGLVNAAKLAADMERVRQMQEEEGKQNVRKLEEFFDSIGNGLDALKEAAREAAERAEKRAAEMQGTREDAQIAHLRARGHGARADRMAARVGERRRVDALKEEGFNEEDATRIARQERLDATGKLGGAGLGARPQPSGLDAFNPNPRGFRPETPTLDRFKEDLKNRPIAADKEAAAGKSSGGGSIVEVIKAAVGPVLDVLKEIKAGVEKTTPEKIAPAPK